ncbi:hypothetical protein Tco_0812084 [Tanacetum coccineum]
MTTLKFADTHNMVAFLSKPAESKGFEQIVDFLNAHPIKHALTVNPTIYTSCIEQFWATVKAKTVNGEVQLQALVDGKKIIITESTMRRDLQLEDAEGVDCLPNATIFEQLALMGYEQVSQKLTFYKAFFSSQWKFLIHTVLQCLSPKTTAWNEFSSTMASAIICLATNQKFNFSKFIFESMVKNLDNVGKFLMYPRFVQVFLDKQLEGMSNHNRIYVTPSHTKKIFRNMRRVGKGFSRRETPLFPTMVVHNQEEMGEGSAIPTDPHHTPTFIQPSPQPQKTQKPRRPKKKDTQVPQSSVLSDNVADEAVYKELDDSLVRAATTASSLEAEQDSGNIDKTQSKATLNEPSSSGTSSGSGPRRQETMGDTIAQTRFENVSKLSNDPLLARGNTLRSGEDSLKLNELMELCTNLQQRVLDLETTKTTQANEIASLKRRVKKLEKKDRSRTHKLKRLYKVGLSARVESSRDEEDLGEDASKQGRIADIDADAGITLVSTHFDADTDMFGVHDLVGDEVVVESEVAVKAGEKRNVVEEVVAVIDAASTIKADKVVIQEPEQGTTTTTPTTIIPVPKPPQDKGKGIMIEEPVVEQVKPMKRLEQIRLDEELAFKLQAEEEEERLAREKAQQIKEANIAWDDVYKEENIFAAKRDKRRGTTNNKSSTKESHVLFEKAMKRTFIDYRTELVEESSKKAEIELVENLKKAEAEMMEGSSKRAGEELEQESIKKQKELKRLSSNIRADGSHKCKRLSQMLKSFRREDLEDLYKMVKAKYGSTRPVEDLDLILYGDLKTMFEPHVEDQVLRLEEKLEQQREDGVRREITLRKEFEGQRENGRREWQSKLNEFQDIMLGNHDTPSHLTNI